MVDITTLLPPPVAPPPQITTIIHLELEDNIDAFSGSEREAWEKALTAISKEPHWEFTIWGPQIENSHRMIVIIGWDYWNDARLPSNLYMELSKPLSLKLPFLRSPPQILNVPLWPRSELLRGTLRNWGGIFELVTLYMPAEQNVAEYLACFDAFRQMELFLNVEGLGCQWPGDFINGYWGWVCDETRWACRSTRACVMLLHWKDPEAERRFKDLDRPSLYADNLQGPADQYETLFLRSLHVLQRHGVEREQVHVELRNWERGNWKRT